jgi:hypothetical protein
MTQIFPVGIKPQTTTDDTDYIAQHKSVKLYIISGIAEQCAAKICEIREICGRKNDGKLE